MNVSQIASRLSTPGLALLALGAALCLAAGMLAAKLWRSEKGAKRIGLIKAAGLALALAGTVILLDFISGM